jgi:hypothetical protein
MSTILVIDDSEYILPEDFDADDDDNLMYVLEKIGSIDPNPVSYFHYLTLYETVELKHTDKKFEHLWFGEVSGGIPIIRYLQRSDRDPLILIALLNYRSIASVLFQDGIKKTSIIEEMFTDFLNVHRHMFKDFLLKLRETQAHVRADVLHLNTDSYSPIARYLTVALDLRTFSIICPGVLDFIHRDDTISSTVTDGDYFIRAHGRVTSSYFKLPDNVTVIMLTSTGSVSISMRGSRKYSAVVDTLLNHMRMLEYGTNLRLYEGGDLVENVWLNFDAREVIGIKLVRDVDLEVLNDFADDLNVLGDDRQLTLFDIIQRLKWREGNSGSSPVNFRLILGSCRVRREGAQAFSEICRVVKDIKRSTRWGQVCNPQEDRPMTHGKTSVNEGFVTLGDDIQFAIGCIRPIKEPKVFPRILEALENILVKYTEGGRISHEEIVNIYTIISAYEDKTEESDLRRMIQRHVDPRLSLTPPSKRSPIELDTDSGI